MKRALALFLCLLLMLPVAALPQFAASADTEGRVIRDGFMKGNTNLAKIPASGKLYDNFSNISSLDLSGYDINDLAYEMDLYLEGDLTAFKKGLKATLTLGSAGSNTKNALSWDLTKIQWQTGKWFRTTLKFTDAKEVSAANPVDLSKVNYTNLSIYTTGGVGLPYTLKRYNLRIVDTSKGESTDVVGDGSFSVEEPKWSLIKTEYPTTETIIAGYNLGDYFPANSDSDATKAVQSLLDAIHEAGGGTVFIPAGTYTFKGTLILPEGVTLQGDWREPTADKPEVAGTIFKIYSGRGKSDIGSAFISMAPNTCVQGINFWYPEQDVNDITPYPVTVLQFKPSSWGKDYTHVRNCTFVNSYRAVQQGPDGSGCPNVYNIYGTPLNVGLHMDGIADIGRFDYITFNETYWENSGLPGAPTSDSDKAALAAYLKENGTALQCARVDWSYWAFINITGYKYGMAFIGSARNDSGDPNAEPAYANGHVYGVNFTDCDTAIVINGISRAGELFANVNINQCNTGILLTNTPGQSIGNTQWNHITIDADKAVVHDGVSNVFMNDITVKRGSVEASCGVLTLSGSTFETAAPQVIMKRGAANGIFQGNTAKTGEFKVDNQSMCPLEISDTPVKMPEIDWMTGDQSKDDTVHAAREVLYVADLDRTGKTDVTAKLQTLLDKAGKEGGGYVFLPGVFPHQANASIEGYRLDGSITVPSGVELVGSVDVGRNAYQIGAILRVYGKQDAPTVILSENSGLRGVVFDYPEQGNTTATLKENYPYAVQGRGENVYLVNVTIRNGYNGVDLMSYKCDNHYVKYLAGYCFRNVIKIGGGAKDGKVINYQMNSSAWWNGDESKYNSWANCPTGTQKGSDQVDENGKELSNKDLTKAGAAHLRDVYTQTNCVIMLVGDVTDEVLYDNFSYLGAVGAKYVAENGKAASGWNVGNAYDYSTVGIQVEAVEKMDFINVQIVSYNYNGVGEKTHQVYLTDQCDDTVNIVNLACWAKPQNFLRADNGTLNVYCGAFTDDTWTHAFVKMGENAHINLQNGTVSNKSIKAWATENLKNLYVSGYVNEQDMSGQDTCQWGQNQVRVLRWDAPENITLPENHGLLFTEAFTAYPTATANEIENALAAGGSLNAISKATADSNVTLVQQDGNDMMHLLHKGAAGTTFARNTTLDLPSGRTSSRYLLETRLNVKSLCENEDSSFALALYSRSGASSSSMEQVIVFQPDGIYVNEEKLSDLTTDTWLRVQVELDLTSIGNKTYTVRVCEDDYKVLAQSDAIRFEEFYQGNASGVGAPTFIANAKTNASAKKDTDVLVDYLTVSKDITVQDAPAFQYGDANSDNEVTTTDARLILQYLAELEPAEKLNMAAADVNCDTDVTTLDARLILQYLAELEPSLPVVG